MCFLAYIIDDLRFYLYHVLSVLPILFVLPVIPVLTVQTVLTVLTVLPGLPVPSPRFLDCLVNNISLFLLS